MRRNSTWFERYQIAMKETLSIKDIMVLRDVGQPTATALSREAKEYCLKNDIPLPPNKAPTDVIMLLTGKNMDYYHDKMVMEAEAIQLQNTIRQ